MNSINVSMSKKLKVKMPGRNIMIPIAVILMILILVVTFLPKKAYAENLQRGNKTVTSVQIESGNTLWSIAKEYYTEDCGSFNSYVEEIKRANGLDSDEIHAGCYLIVPYYEGI
ncbi:MAG: LysM peptidoglycan-binding domain-containing protein [Lachnospiraceae bacterium]|nr:LysM peptidoglycan-binding domain-containing protein [Lachnospiraceae bacterium]